MRKPRPPIAFLRVAAKDARVLQEMPLMAAPVLAPIRHDLPLMSPQGERLVRIAELIQRLGVSRSTIYRYLDQGRLPPPVQLPGRTVAWKASVIEDGIASLPSS